MSKKDDQYLPSEPAPEGNIASIPTIKYLITTYGTHSSSEDRRATKTFLEFETKEKLQRLRNELIYIKNGQVKQSVLNDVVGLGRKLRYQSYEEWASIMLLFLAKK